MKDEEIIKNVMDKHYSETGCPGKPNVCQGCLEEVIKLKNKKWAEEKKVLKDTIKDRMNFEDEQYKHILKLKEEKKELEEGLEWLKKEFKIYVKSVEKDKKDLKKKIDNEIEDCDIEDIAIGLKIAINLIKKEKP